MTAITVTAAHIIRGVREDCEHCPVALAILDVFPDAYVAVGPDTCTIGMPDSDDDDDVNLPPEVLNFIWDYDDGGTPAPFTFDLDYPAVTRC